MIEFLLYLRNSEFLSHNVVSMPVCVYVLACKCVYAGLHYVCVCLHVCQSVCYQSCSSVSCATNSLAHTWLHSSTFRHSDESPAPFFHFCSHSVLLGHTDSYLSVSHTHINRVQNFLCVFKKKDRQYKMCLVFKDAALRFFFGARHILTLNIGKPMTSPATSLCQQCSNQA